MPNRILRDWTDSEAVDLLSVQAERFFTRLIMKADDYGRYSANLKLLRSTIFPLKTDIRETDITRWLAECEKSGLIALYSVASKGFLQINNFKQTLRQKNEKYPAHDLNSTCTADDMQTLSGCVLETKRIETKGKEEKAPPSLDEVVKYFKENGYSDEAAKKAHKYYEENDWHDSQGNKVRAWKQKMISVWFKPEHKIKSLEKAMVD